MGECPPGLEANRNQVSKFLWTFLYWDCAVQWNFKKALLLPKAVFFFLQLSLYCDGTNSQTPSGPCQPGYFCTGGAKSALQHDVMEGHYSLAGAFKPEPCPLGTFQPVSTWASTWGLSRALGNCKNVGVEIHEVFVSLKKGVLAFLLIWVITTCSAFTLQEKKNQKPLGEDTRSISLGENTRSISPGLLPTALLAVFITFSHTAQIWKGS